MRWLNGQSWYRWVRCNVFNRHYYFWCGDTDLYGQQYWFCSWCNRVKHRSYDRNLIDKKRKKIQDAAFKKLLE
jgi:hypothetical protein